VTERPRRWALDEFLGLFDLEDLGAGVYKATNPERGPWTRVFGGQVIAQAIRSAQLTVPAERAIHSAHAYFIRPGKVGEPIYFHVERPRDGRSFTTRYVKAAQGPEVIFDMIASFHVDEEGAEFQVPRATDVPMPEEAPEPEMPIEYRGRMRSMMPFDMRELGPQPPGASAYRSTRRVWFRTNGQLPDDPAIHACSPSRPTWAPCRRRARRPRARTTCGPRSRDSCPRASITPSGSTAPFAPTTGS
jgi:acyl-CoA thioesterase-2